MSQFILKISLGTIMYLSQYSTNNKIFLILEAFHIHETFLYLGKRHGSGISISVKIVNFPCYHQ